MFKNRYITKDASSETDICYAIKPDSLFSIAHPEAVSINQMADGSGFRISLGTNGAVYDFRTTTKIYDNTNAISGRFYSLESLADAINTCCKEEGIVASIEDNHLSITSDVVLSFSCINTPINSPSCVDLLGFHKVDSTDCFYEAGR